MFRAFAAPNVVRTGGTCRSVFAFDEGTGRTLWSVYPDVLHELASITKLMTAILTVELVDHPEEVPVVIRASENTSDGGWTLPLDTDDEMTLSTVFNAMLVGSLTDCADVLARVMSEEYLGGANFVTRMNARGVEIGLTDTDFDTPGGGAGTSTARDVCRLLQFASSFPAIMTAVSQDTYDAVITGGPNPRTTTVTQDLEIQDHPNIIMGKGGLPGGGTLHGVYLWEGSLGQRVYFSNMNSSSSNLRQSNGLKTIEELEERWTWASGVPEPV